MGISILEQFGSAVFAIFIAILITVVVRWLNHEFHWSPLTSLLTVYLIIYWTVLDTPRSREIYNWLISLFPNLDVNSLDGTLTVIMFIAVGWVILKVVVSAKRKLSP